MVKKSHKRHSHKSHKHKKHYYTKKKKYNKNKKGGNGSNIINPLNLQSTPNQIYSFPAGSTSAANAAQNYLNNMSQKQTELNNILHNGGGGKKKQSKKQRGGVADIAASATGAPPGDYYSCTAQNPNFTTVAQFSSSGPDVSPLNANNSSITTNATSIAGKNNATNDCYASGTCQEVDCPAGANEVGAETASTNEVGAVAGTTSGGEVGTGANEVGAVAVTTANEVGTSEASTPTQSGGSRKKRRKGKKSKKNKSKGTKRI
jgi:hypothetical protein